VGTYKTEGIVLKRKNFGEADKILTIYTKHYGKIKVLAKGIRKPTSKKSPTLELFNWVKIFVSRGRGLDIIKESQIIRSFRGWKKNLGKVEVAFYFCELVERLAPENVPNLKIFNLLTGSLLGLSQINEGSLEQAVKIFEQRILEESGFWPKGNKPKIDFKEYIEKIIERKLKSRDFFRDN